MEKVLNKHTTLPLTFRFPLKDVEVRIVDHKKEVKSPLFDDGFYRLNQNEFSMDVAGVGWFYAANGNYISLNPDPEAKKNEIELYLNGSCYGAVLHQRKILPLHGSCFVLNNQGVMICGESGMGKSSLTAAFCKNGSEFLTDDVSPLIFKDNYPCILPLSDRIKLWQDSLSQLELPTDKLAKISKNYEKYYLRIKAIDKSPFPLSNILILETHNKPEIIFNELNGIEKFTALRNEIYRWEYLEGMPETEKYYLEQIIYISTLVKVYNVQRPEQISIDSMRKELQEFVISTRKIYA